MDWATCCDLIEFAYGIYERNDTWTVEKRKLR